MFQPHIIYKTLLPKPLLFAIALCVVMIAMFSPVFSGNANAQFVCQTNSMGTQFYSCTDTDEDGKKLEPWATKENCENECNGLGQNCLLASAIAKCAETFIPEAGTIDKDGTYTPNGPSWDLALLPLIWILELINFGLKLLITLFANFFDAAIAISLAGLSGIDAVTIGWTITRDIANIFFIFALLIIAIATILRLESYGAKQLLPKLIIIALLINFSLVIAFTVVDASNILALAFISEIGDPTVSQNIATVLQLGKMTDVKTLSSDKHTPIDPNKSLSQGFETVVKTQLNQPFTSDEGVVKVAPIEQNEPSATVIRFFWQATILILQLTLMFVFVALSVMLLIRSVALIMIFVLAPLGFLASVLPSTRTYSNQWWHKLFQWSFFFPASAFMMYLAIAFGAQMSQTLSGGNHVINTGILFSYFATVAFLMGSLVVAKQMGAVGAAAAIGIGVGIAKKARGYAGKGALSATKPIQRGAATASNAFLESKAAQRLANVPLARQMLRIPAAISQQQQGVAKNEAKRIANLSPKQQASMLKTLSARAQVEAFDSMNEKRQAQVVQAMDPKEDQIKFFDRVNSFDPKLAGDVANATGNAHQAMRMLHGEYRNKELSSIPDNDTRYQQRLNDYLGELSDTQMRKMDAQSIGENKFFRQYFAANTRNFNDVTNNREQISASQQMLHALIRELNVNINQPASDIANELADKIEDQNGPYKNKQLANQIRTNIGINLIINPNMVGIRSRRGNINVGATPAPGGTP